MLKDEEFNHLEVLFNRWKGHFKEKALKCLEMIRKKYTYLSGYVYRPYNSYPIWKIIISKSKEKALDYYFYEPHANEVIDLDIKAFEGFNELSDLCINFIDEESGLNEEILEIISGYGKFTKFHEAVSKLYENSSFYIAVDNTLIQNRFKYFIPFGEIKIRNNFEIKYFNATKFVPDALKTTRISSGVVNGLKSLNCEWLLPYIFAMVKWLLEKTFEPVFYWVLYFIYRESFCQVIAENCFSGNNYFPTKIESVSIIENNFILLVDKGNDNINIFLQREE